MMKRAWLMVPLSAWLLGCNAAPTPPLVGNDRDAHGCIGSAGYRWCAAQQQCVRPWELPLNAAEGSTFEARFAQYCTPTTKTSAINH